MDTEDRVRRILSVLNSRTFKYISWTKSIQGLFEWGQINLLTGKLNVINIFASVVDECGSRFWFIQRHTNLCSSRCVHVCQNWQKLWSLCFLLYKNSIQKSCHSMRNIKLSTRNSYQQKDHFGNFSWQKLGIVLWCCNYPWCISGGRHQETLTRSSMGKQLLVCAQFVMPWYPCIPRFAGGGNAILRMDRATSEKSSGARHAAGVSTRST